MSLNDKLGSSTKQQTELSDNRKLVISADSISKYNFPPINETSEMSVHIEQRIKDLNARLSELPLKGQMLSFFDATINNYRTFYINSLLDLYDNTLVTDFIKADMEIYGLIHTERRLSEFISEIYLIENHMKECREAIFLNNDEVTELFLSAQTESRVKSKKGKSEKESSNQFKTTSDPISKIDSDQLCQNTFYEINNLTSFTETHRDYFTVPIDISDYPPFIKKITFLIKALNKRYNKDLEVIRFIKALETAFLQSCDKFNHQGISVSSLMIQMLYHTDEFNVRTCNDYKDLYHYIDKKLRFSLKEHKDNNNKNTALEPDDTTTNTSDYLEEKIDDPEPRRIGRDFKSAQWSKKPKLKTKTPAKDEQERFALRTFPQVYRIIDKAIQESGEGKTEWIVRAIIDRLMIDHPHLFEELKSQKDEFPEVRSDAKTGIDFMYE